MPQSKKILVLSIAYQSLVRIYDNENRLRKNDFDHLNDGELDNLVNKHQSPRQYEAWQNCLSTENEELISHIKIMQEIHGYEKIICCSSGPQNFLADLEDSCRESLYSGSSYVGLKLFVDRLKKEYSHNNISIEFDLTIIGDDFSELGYGETINKTLQWYEGSNISDSLLKTCPVDKSKISLHWMYMQHFAHQFSGYKIDYIIIENDFKNSPPSTHRATQVVEQGVTKLFMQPVATPAVADGLIDIYSRHHNLIPEDTSLTIIPYQRGELLLRHMSCTLGTGLLQSNYIDLMKKMMALSSQEQYHCWRLFYTFSKDKEELLDQLNHVSEQKQQHNSEGYFFAAQTNTFFAAKANQYLNLAKKEFITGIALALCSIPLFIFFSEAAAFIVAILAVSFIVASIYHGFKGNKLEKAATTYH